MTAFPELTKEENAEIDAARAEGFASYFPCVPNGEAQARNTLKASREYIEGVLTVRKNHVIQDLQNEKGKIQPDAAKIIKLACLAAEMELALLSDRSSPKMLKARIVSAVSCLQDALFSLEFVEL